MIRIHDARLFTKVEYSNRQEKWNAFSQEDVWHHDDGSGGDGNNEDEDEDNNDSSVTEEIRKVRFEMGVAKYNHMFSPYYFYFTNHSSYLREAFLNHERNTEPKLIKYFSRSNWIWVIITKEIEKSHCK